MSSPKPDGARPLKQYLITVPDTPNNRRIAKHPLFVEKRALKATWLDNFWDIEVEEIKPRIKR